MPAESGASSIPETFSDPVWILDRPLSRTMTTDIEAKPRITAAFIPHAYAHTPAALDLPDALTLLDPGNNGAIEAARIGSKRSHGTAGGRQGHRHDDRADGALCDPDARRLRRRRHQDRIARRRCDAADRPDTAPRHGSGVPQYQPQQAQPLPRSEETRRARRGAAADRDGRRAGLQCAAAGDGAAATRLRRGLENQSAADLCWRVRLWPGRALCGEAGL